MTSMLPRVARCVVAALAMGIASPELPALAGSPTACDDLRHAVPVDGGPLFLPSYPTAQPGPLRGVAFLYDNAVAAVALIACGEAERARRIGDAIVWAQAHDRAWRDGRLRNAYAGGSVHDDPVKLGGWWDASQNRWLEDEYQVSSDSGNMAWAMLTLLALDPAHPDAGYRDAALRLGKWLAARADDRGAKGFTGGFFGWEPNAAAVKWKSTEHNTDLAAAFARLAAATGDPQWFDHAANARGFVTAMWDEGRECFAAGVTDDGVTQNHIIAIDAQLWPLLAIPGQPTQHAEAVFKTIDAALKFDGGYTYSDAGRALWTEGTAQAELTAKLFVGFEAAAPLGDAVEAERAPGGEYYATPAQSLSTGFADPSNPAAIRAYYHLPHLGATAWAALAEQGYNPF